MQRLIRVTTAAIVLSVGIALTSTTAHAASRSNCAVIVNEFRAQGASAGVAQRFGQIAWRESGCQMVCVTDRDDHACSRYGLNFKGNMGRFWFRLCGASSVNDTKGLRQDTECAWAAFRKMGWRPWR